ncbi:ATP-grasp domain-containing protein [Methylogaea oryzae]|uniref:ATP-grasp domain-containing protein n=2 Tax=Methylogaea oryzae TaxID=1295382 RepID=A0A8D4VM67_9GAMM|nr:ATP-grasp domain-containing protein [Methylogaea oryzae]BBL69804.1 hypothetical protein MoryE10_04100 [Methylogaea oryzae]
MKILLFEYITGGGLAGLELPPGLVREGRAMAVSLACDLLSIAGVSLVVPWDGRLPLPEYADHPRVQLMPVESALSFRNLWRAALERCDAVWPIAPETGGVLSHVCRDVAQSGVRLLNCPPGGVSLATSKRQTVDRLTAHGVPAVPTYRVREVPAGLPWPRVVKPDDGVGCQDTYVVESPAQLENYSAEAASNDWLIQPYVHGAPLSLCALFWRGDAALLTVNRQSMALSDEGAFRLTGCEVNAITDDVGQYSMLTRQIAAAVPELEGYAGVDFIQTASGPVVLEINPRLTSSYSALGRALPCNPAALILNLYETGRLPSVDAKAGRRVLVDW